MAVQHPVMQPWIWEFGTRDGKTVYDTTEFWDLPAVKTAVAASFADYAYEEVERRGIRGTSVLVNLSGDGRYQDTGHWVYRKRPVPAAVADAPRPGSTIEREAAGCFRVHTPLVLTTDVWPSHADDEDPSTPILGWVMENSLNGYSMGFASLDEEPTTEDVERFQRDAFTAIRDAAIPREDGDSDAS